MKYLTDQHDLTVIAPIETEYRDKIERLMADENFKPVNNIPDVHFARMILLRREQLLVYSVNHDGDLNDHLAIICRIPELADAFSCCRGYPAHIVQEQAIPYFVQLYRQKIDAFYRGHRGLSLSEILQEKEMYERIQIFLNSASRNIPPEELHLLIKDHIRMVMPGLNDFRPYRLLFIPAVLLRVFYFIPLLLIVLSLFSIHWFLGIAFVAFIVLMIWLLRYIEKRDAELVSNDVAMSNTGELMSNEDFIAQNQMTHYVPVKPGMLRQFFLRMGLSLVNLQAIYSFNKGTLSGISSIHFARWLVINNGKDLLFFSNFDGTWENYLSDFVDRAAEGLTLIWSNTLEFPRTRFLFKDGASDEERFKNWTRKYQVKTEKWYSAYKDLTVKNIILNHNIRVGLQKNMQPRQAAEWLKLL